MSTDVQEAFEANSVAAETSRAKPGSKVDIAAAQTKQEPEQLCSVVFDIETRQRVHIVPRPVYNVSPDGKKAVSFDFGRLDVVQAGKSSTKQCA